MHVENIFTRSYQQYNSLCIRRQNLYWLLPAGSHWQRDARTKMCHFRIFSTSPEPESLA